MISTKSVWARECGIGGSWNSECRSEESGNAKCGNGELAAGTIAGGNGYHGRRESGFAELERIEVPSLSLSERHAGFNEVELCFTDEQVKEEAQRCLQCDLEIFLAKAQKDL